MKQLGNWFKPIYLIALAFIAGAIYFLFKKKNITDFTVYEGIADAQYNAMRDYGTDEELLFKTLEGLTKNDLIKVYKSFGLKTYSTGGQGLSLLGFNFYGTPMDLFGWYSAELNDKERAQMRTVWEKSGLNLTF